MSLCSPHTQMSYPHGPIGWSGYKSYHHYRAVYPTSKSSMHVNLHKKVPRGQAVKASPNTRRGLVNGVRTLDRQRPREKRFVGIKDLRTTEITDLSKRLAMYEPLRMPAEGRGALPAIDKLNLCHRSQRIYSAAEVRRIVRKIGQTHCLDEADARELVSKLADVELSPHEQKVYAKLSTGEVKKIVDRLASYDPTIWPPMSRGLPSRDPDLSDVLTKKHRSVSQEELDTIVGRLTKYDPQKWPPGSPQKKAPASSSFDSKKLSKDEVAKVVERLSNFDPKKWPPESVGVKKELMREVKEGDAVATKKEPVKEEKSDEWEFHHKTFWYQTIYF